MTTKATKGRLVLKACRCGDESALLFSSLDNTWFRAMCLSCGETSSLCPSVTEVVVEWGKK